MWYKVDWNKLGVLLLPTFLRKRRIIVFTQLFSSSIIEVYDRWLEMRQDNIFNLAHNSQVCYLRKVLNDKYDKRQRRIKIIEGYRYKREYIYTIGERKPRFLGTLFLRQNSDYADTGNDFLVLVPQELLTENISEIKAVVDYYKLASKRYNIQTDE